MRVPWWVHRLEYSKVMLQMGPSMAAGMVHWLHLGSGMVVRLMVVQMDIELDFLLGHGSG